MIEVVDSNNFSEVVPMIRDYQQFYQVENIDDDKNREFFSRFLSDHSRGMLHLYRYNGKAVGFSTLYFNYSSSRAEEVAVLNDLFVLPAHRNRGIGRALLLNAEQVAKSLGYLRLQWLTANENQQAQVLYDDSGAVKSGWYFYVKQL